MTSPKGGSPIVSNKPLGLLLASESPRRKALLAQLGIVPDAVRAASIDETPHPDELPRDLALRLAQSKAWAAALECARASLLILAADTVVALGRRILPKAETADEVRGCLRLLSGRRHKVLTAVAVLPPDDVVRTRIVTSAVRFRRLDAAEIEAYVACGEGIGKAGGYAIQGGAGAFAAAINGSYSAIVGLPLSETVLLLRGLGYRC